MGFLFISYIIELMNKKILIVDNNASDLMLTSFVLAKEGYDCVRFDANLDAYKRLESDNQFELLILNLNMPQMQTSDLLKKLKNNAKLKDIPVLITSNQRNSRELKFALDLGAKDFLPKPLSPPSIKHKVATTLNQAKMNANHQQVDQAIAKGKEELSYVKSYGNNISSIRKQVNNNETEAGNHLSIKMNSTFELLDVNNQSIKFKSDIGFLAQSELNLNIGLFLQLQIMNAKFHVVESKLSDSTFIIECKISNLSQEESEKLQQLSLLLQTQNQKIAN